MIANIDHTNAGQQMSDMLARMQDMICTKRDLSGRFLSAKDVDEMVDTVAVLVTVWRRKFSALLNAGVCTNDADHYASAHTLCAFNYAVTNS